MTDGIPTVAKLMDSPLAKYITLAANDCGYSGTAVELIVTYVHPLFLKAHSAASKLDNPSWKEATSDARRFDTRFVLPMSKLSTMTTQ